MVWWVGAAVSVASGLLQRNEGKRAGKKADEIARMNAENIQLETKEELRRMDRTQQFTLGSFQAQQSASGIMNTGQTSQAVRNTLDSEFAKQRDWVVESGKRQSDIARKGGEGVGRGAELQGGLDILSGLTAPGKGGTNPWWMKQ